MATTTTPRRRKLEPEEPVLEDKRFPTPRRSSKRRLVAWLVGILLVAGATYAARQILDRSPAPAALDASRLYKVEPTELLVTVTEDGNVESANNVDVKSKVAGGSTILWIIPDGTEVKAGDKLVELDASAIEDQISTQKISYNKARAAVVQAEKNYEVAKLAVREYLEGTYKKEVETAETQVTIAEENLRSSKNALDYAQRMFQRGYISELELESQEFTVKRAELELSAAETTLHVLQEFTKVKMLEELQSQVETADSTLESEKAAYELEEAKLQRLQTQLENCTILAPQDGMVVYANDPSGGRFGGQQSVAVEEGAAVRDRQTLLRLPDLTRMQVKVKVHETKVEQLALGMRARINIQGRQYHGSVTSIANQHEATSFFSGNVKEYATVVRIDGEVESLRPGMTAEVEILVSHLKDILAVPVSAVVEQRGEYVCWVKTTSGQVERRPLVLGLSDDNFVEVKDGLVSGDLVIRNPRSVVAEARVSVTDVEEVDVAEQFGTPAPGSGPATLGARPGGGPDHGISGSGASAANGPGATDPGQPDAGGPSFDGPGGPGAGEPGPGGPGSRRRGSLMDLDQDGDGQISREEAPAPMQGVFDRIDTDGDGFISQTEADAMRRRFQQSGVPGGGPPPGGP